MRERLERVYREAESICINRNSRVVCMSDCHRGVGNHGDNFLPNQNLFFAALQYYYDRQFTYIELGDGDELWENGDLSRIVEIHSDAFWLMSRFYKEGRFHMLYGNHDQQKNKMKYMKNHCWQYYCDSTHRTQELFPNLEAKEGIVLKDGGSGHEILLLHGHQGDLLNDTLWPIAAWLVRFVWRPLEMIGVLDPTSAARNYKKRKKTEIRLDKFSKEKQMLVIAGHTHRPILPSPGESFYLNDGSCVHPRCITAMEIENGAITLVKWCLAVRHNNALTIRREILEGPILWEKYWQFSQAQ